MYDATHAAIKYHTANLADAREALVLLTDRLQETKDLNPEIQILLNDTVIKIRVHTELLEQAVSMLDAPKPAPFWKTIFKK